MTVYSATDLDHDKRAWINLAKGICIVLVVMMHTALGVEKVLGQTGVLHSLVAWWQQQRDRQRGCETAEETSHLAATIRAAEGAKPHPNG